MTKIISVVTAVTASSAYHLPDAHASLLAQKLPAGWDWQWVIQEDGETEAVAPHVPDDPRISFGQGRAGGGAMARTMALSRIEGPYIKVLEAGDMLTQGALARDLAALTDHEASWATSGALHLLPDGSTAESDQEPADGALANGAVLKYWRANNHRTQVDPGTLFVQRDVLLALGGWTALPAAEGTGLVLALSVIAQGWFTAEAGLLRRMSPDPAACRAEPATGAEDGATAAVIEARARALAGLHWWRFVPA